MDENQYKSTYVAVNERGCVFEKAVLSRRCGCTRAKRFYLADREGVACTLASAEQRCSRVLEHLRQSAKFSLRLTGLTGALPHAKEIKVQTGGLLGLQCVVDEQLLHAKQVEDIDGLLVEALQRFGKIESFPYQEIVKSVVHFEARPKRKKDR